MPIASPCEVKYKPAPKNRIRNSSSGVSARALGRTDMDGLGRLRGTGIVRGIDRGQKPHGWDARKQKRDAERPVRSIAPKSRSEAAGDRLGKGHRVALAAQIGGQRIL